SELVVAIVAPVVPTRVVGAAAYVAPFGAFLEADAMSLILLSLLEVIDIADAKNK
ncbi:hypothetical protein PINS_up007121, partial [Pythium insidiosum]